LKEGLEFLTNLLNKFSEIKVVGAQDDEEIDSLEHVALFHKEKLFVCSPSWANKLEETDKNMLYL